ncbi:LytR/AlgR family response regulator transcription factor [Flavobacterium gelatinilyticum]|uniref:LytR/AlgR family response regulator transcription factor n=1 Tax=Flavobacterium gelatinilyticum TaxID=3003260 RepID=UPI00248071D7|nr:LytTR family DNA-binding domain-containing protein [Flavobacterium gelatinilyticum]
MEKYSYIIIDDDEESISKTKRIADGFSELYFLGSASNNQDGLNLVLEFKPEVVFLEIKPKSTSSNLSLNFINELHHFLTVLPHIVVITSGKDLAFDAIKQGVFDYILKPLVTAELLKTILRLNKWADEMNSADLRDEISFLVTSDSKERQSINKSLIICIKSYGDHRYINADDICYFKADNNSTDIYLNSGEMITAFKTLKHFELVLTYPFFRIHNSYIINKNYIARIHSGNSVCYIKNTSKKIPFSRTYKANVDLIIGDFFTGNYLEV